jgi:Zn finger protein HypA/HybF involved in hydrogenase expression
MHELGVVKNIIDIVCKEINQLPNNPKIDMVYFKTSIIHAVHPQSLSFYFDAMKTGFPSLVDATLDIEVLPVKGYCSGCDSVYYTMELYCLCKKCNRSIEIEVGDDMTVDSISLFEDQSV